MKVLDLLIGLALTMAIVFFGYHFYEKISLRQHQQLMSEFEKFKKEESNKTLKDDFNKLSTEINQLKFEKEKMEIQLKLAKENEEKTKEALLKEQEKSKLFYSQYLDSLKKNEEDYKKWSQSKSEKTTEIKIVRDESLIDSLESKITKLELEKEEYKKELLNNELKKRNDIEQKLTTSIENMGQLKNEKSELTNKLEQCQSQVALLKELTKKEVESKPIEAKRKEFPKTRIGEEMRLREPRTESKTYLFEPIETAPKIYKKQPVDSLN